MKGHIRKGSLFINHDGQLGFCKQGTPLFPGTKFPFFLKKNVKTLQNGHRNDCLSGGLVGEDTQKHGGEMRRRGFK